MAKQTLEEFLADPEVPTEIRDLVRDRLAEQEAPASEDEE